MASVKMMTSGTNQLKLSASMANNLLQKWNSFIIGK